MTRRCAHCGNPFRLRPQMPRQTFCSAPACQRARKRQWQKDKLKMDADYRANQRAAQRAWAARNVSYWHDWRQGQHTSAPHNGVRHARTDAATAQIRRAATPAKMDVWNLAWDAPFGLYRLSKLPEFPDETAVSWIVVITPADTSGSQKMDV